MDKIPPKSSRIPAKVYSKGSRTSRELAEPGAELPNFNLAGSSPLFLGGSAAAGVFDILPAQDTKIEFGLSFDRI